ncbi:MAG: 6-phosphogluconolactonase [Nitrospirae bacterium]|nr:6-phosphogluconolactonase [Nitrospirota bacterium]
MRNEKVVINSWNGTRTLTVCRNLEDLGRQAAALVSRLIREAVERRGRATLALAVGTTPRALYRALARPPFVEAIPWNLVHLFWGDERCVPPDHPESNYRMAHEDLISKVPIPPENIHRMRGEIDPQTAAVDYERELRACFQVAAGEWPRFDAVILGIGADGHVASLFPGSSALEETARWVASPFVEQLQAHRLTLTLPVLNHAAQIMFLVAGREKAAILKRVLAEEPSHPLLPAQRIQPAEGKVYVFADEEASGPTDSARASQAARGMVKKDRLRRRPLA